MHGTPYDAPDESPDSVRCIIQQILQASPASSTITEPKHATPPSRGFESNHPLSGWQPRQQQFSKIFAPAAVHVPSQTQVKTGEARETFRSLQDAQQGLSQVANDARALHVLLHQLGG